MAISEEELISQGFNNPKSARANLEIIERLNPNIDLSGLIKLASLAPLSEEALNYLERILSSLNEITINKFAEDETALGDLITLCGSSPYLSEVLIKNPTYTEEVFFTNLLHTKKETKQYIDELKIILKNITSEEEIINELRRYKNKEFVRIGLRDLLYIATMEDITEEISDIAEASIEVSLNYIHNTLQQLYGKPMCIDQDGNEKEAEFSVLGMGKLGGRELNFSSDIDIIYLYETEKGKTEGVDDKSQSKIELHSYFIKVGEKLTKIIGSNTVEGTLFRVDLDLRPDGPSGLMANSLRAMEVYYEAWGRSWERAAMIKVRPVGGSKKLGNEFLKMIEPFVFRKYLDFTNIEEIRTMKEQIDISLKRKKGDVVDVKLGRGGIREIEFFVQANQLIHGGKNKNLRTKKTLDTLKMLFLNKLITEEEANTLTSCYIYLRNLEHRIQIVQGRQSQSIPTNKTELLRLAAMTGIRKDGDEGLDCRFWEEYKSYSDKVHQIYNTLFYSSENEMENALDEIYLPFIDKEICDDELLEILNNQNVISAQEALNSIILIRDGSKGSRLSVKAKTQREKLLPHIIKKSIDTGLPMKALKHLEMFFAATGSRINLYSMIRENTELLNILIKIFAESTYLANVLIRHPENLDTLLSSEKGKATKSIEELKNDFSVMIKTCQHDDYEEKLQTVRNFKNEEFFRIGLNDLSLANDFNKTSIEISNVADVILDGAIEIAKDELRSKFGVLVNDSENNYFILGLGKYGSKELTYGSDLDILFVYESPDNAVTDGVKKVSAMEYYTALSRKIINLLSTNTKEGIAFKLDAELRPSGSAGPLVTSVNSLMDYQKNKAQFWEHQALIRQRPVAGNLSFGELVSEKLYDIIFNKKISDDDIKEVVRLRQRMEKEIANEKEGVYDLKTGYGGMVDIEFIIQVMQLKFGYEIADLRTPYTIDGLNKLVQHDIISKIDGEILKNAFDYYKKLQSRLRIEFDKPEGKINTLTDELKGTIYKDNNEKAELIKKLTDTKQSVRNLFTKIIK